MQDGKCYPMKLFGVCTLAWVEHTDSETCSRRARTVQKISRHQQCKVAC